jgi:uncharacterized protein YjbJ (UPF0337 family)
MDDRKKDDSVGEEMSAFGQRIKGTAKDAVGAVTGNRRLEREGEREAAAGRARQAENRVMEETDALPGATVGEHPEYVSRLYRTPEEANRAYESLTTMHGYDPDDVSVVMSDETRTRYFGDEHDAELGETKVAEGFGKGGAIGGTIGAALGALFAVGTSVVVPGLGLVVAGPIAAALAGAGAGGATGGAVGALIGAGIPKDRAAAYHQGLRDGGIVIGARPRDARHAAKLENEFGQHETDVRR